MVSSEPFSMITVKSEVLLASAQKSPANTPRVVLSLITKNHQTQDASGIAAENLSAPIPAASTGFQFHFRCFYPTVLATMEWN